MKEKIIGMGLVMGLLAAGCREPWQRGVDESQGGGSASTSTSAETGRILVDVPGDGADTAVKRVAVWTEAGDVAIVNAGTGEVLSVAPGGGLGGDVDIAWDPWKSRLITFEGDPDAQWGEVASYPVEVVPGGVEIGSRKHEVWIDGIARLVASPFGPVILEESYGPRWRLVSPEGPTPSVAAPLPRSIATGPTPQGGFAIRALTYGFSDDAPEIWSAEVTPEGVETVGTPELTSVEEAVSPWAPVRWTPSEDGGYLARADSWNLGISSLDDEGVTTSTSAIVASVDRVEGLWDMGGPTLVALVRGSADVVIARFAPGGGVDCAATLDLPGDAKEAFSFFSRDVLVLSPDRLLVGTSAGVFAVSVPEGCPCVPVVEPGFQGDALRGPIAALVTLP